MPNLTASISHQLSRQEARQRIQDGLKDLHRQQAFLLGGLRETWHGDIVDLSGLVMGQAVSGRISVEDRVVQVELALPGLLGVIAAGLKSQIVQQGRRLLEDRFTNSPPAPAR